MIDANFIESLEQSRMNANSLLCCWEDKEARDVCVRLDLAYRDLEEVLYKSDHHYRFSYKVFEEFLEPEEKLDHPNSRPKLEYFIQFDRHLLRLCILRDGIVFRDKSLWDNLNFSFGPEVYDAEVKRVVDWNPTEEFLKIFPNSTPPSLSGLDDQFKFYFKGLCELPEFINAYVDYLVELDNTRDGNSNY